jgi:hypothetical protein
MGLNLAAVDDAGLATAESSIVRVQRSCCRRNSASPWRLAQRLPLPSSSPVTETAIASGGLPWATARWPDRDPPPRGAVEALVGLAMSKCHQGPRSRSSRSPPRWRTGSRRLWLVRDRQQAVPEDDRRDPCQLVAPVLRSLDSAKSVCGRRLCGLKIWTRTEATAPLRPLAHLRRGRAPLARADRDLQVSW